MPNVDGIELRAPQLRLGSTEFQQPGDTDPTEFAPHVGVAVEVITSDLFQIPTSAATSSRLAVVNAKFDTGIPPTADQYEVVLVDG